MCADCAMERCDICTFEDRNAAKLRAANRRHVRIDDDVDRGWVVVVSLPERNIEQRTPFGDLQTAVRALRQAALHHRCINAAAPLMPVGNGKGVAVPAGFRVIRAMPDSRVIRMRTPDRDWHVHSRHDTDIGFRLAWQSLIDDPCVLEA